MPRFLRAIEFAICPRAGPMWSVISKIRDDQLHYEWKKMEAKENRIGLNVGKIMPRDLVLVRTEEKSNYSKYGVNYCLTRL